MARDEGAHEVIDLLLRALDDVYPPLDVSDPSGLRVQLRDTSGDSHSSQSPWIHNGGLFLEWALDRAFASRAKAAPRRDKVHGSPGHGSAVPVALGPRVHWSTFRRSPSSYWQPMPRWTSARTASTWLCAPPPATCRI